MKLQTLLGIWRKSNKICEHSSIFISYSHHISILYMKELISEKNVIQIWNQYCLLWLWIFLALKLLIPWLFETQLLSAARVLTIYNEYVIIFCQEGFQLPDTHHSKKIIVLVHKPYASSKQINISVSAREMQLQSVSNGVTAFLH